MEHKTWLWRKKSSQKIISVNGKSELSLAENGEEKDEVQAFEKSLKDLNQQLFDALNESNAKDDLLAKQAKVAEEAIAGWEKAEAETVTVKQDLDEVLLQRAASDEKIRNLDVSLKECMHLLHVHKEENRQIISDAVMKISREQEKAHKLEVRLAETDRKLLKSCVENSNLSKVLELKEKTIEELNESKNQAEENFAAIVAKLDALEKNNASLVYEVCMLQKELETRDAEREFNRKSADAAHKQHLGNMKRIGKIEKECQKLRVMLRNRLPGPAALSKMRREAELLDHTTETRRKKLNDPEYVYDAAGKSVGSLIEQLNATEVENKIIKETLSRKNSELQSLRVMFARTASKLSQAETQLESPRVQARLELARSSPALYDFPLGSISEDARAEDSINCAESWASALISELENFRPGKPVTPTGRTSTSSDLSLMDDFIEMEKLAIESADKPFGNSDSKLDSSEVTDNTLDSEFEKSVSKLAEHIEGIIRINSSQQRDAGEDGGASPYHKSTSANGYIARVFLWETSELSTVLRRFVDVCTTPLNGKGDLKVFSGELASTLEWMMDHSIPLEDVSKMKEMIKNRIGDYESHSNNKVEAVELKFDTSLYVLSQMETIESKLTDENKRLKHEILNTESRKKVLEERLESVSAKNQLLAFRLEESTKSITDLQVELETLKENMPLIEYQIETLKENKPLIEFQIENLKENKPLIEFQSGNQNSLMEYQSGNQNSKEDLGTQLTVTRVEYHPKFSTLEVELEGKSTRWDESEACPELPLQLESVSDMGIQRYDTDQEQKQLRTDFEISAASKKLAECQETIQNLGKQLKALASPRDASFFDKMIPIPDDARISHRPQLLDHMQEEDNVNSEAAKSPLTKEVLFTEQKQSTKASKNYNADLLFELNFTADDDYNTDKSVKIINPSLVKSPEWIRDSDESGRNTAQTNVGTLALVLLPKKQKGGIGLLRKLLLRKRE